MNNDFILIHRDVAPEVFIQVLKAKELLKSGEATSVADAVKKTNLSRSTYYKYSDYIFTLTDGLTDKKATISMVLEHQSGLLSKILETIALHQGNILTISQSAPIENKASVTISIDISNMSKTFSAFSQEIQNIKGVYRFTLEGIETNKNI